MSSYGSETPTHDEYARGLMDRRQRYHDFLSLLQTNQDDHRRPLYAAEVSEIAARSHQMTLDLRDQLRPRSEEIPELWRERELATVEIPELSSSAGGRYNLGSRETVSWSHEPMQGLQSLGKWRAVSLPREAEQPGRAARSTVERGARVFMPVALMTGARDAIEEALTELGWLPTGRTTDFNAAGGI